MTPNRERVIGSGMEAFTRESLLKGLRQNFCHGSFDLAAIRQQEELNYAMVAFAFALYGNPTALTYDQWQTSLECPSNRYQVN